MTMAEIAQLLCQLKNWEYTNEGCLKRIWLFHDFQTALSWVNQVGLICETSGHYANVTVGWAHDGGEIETKALVGLSRADVELAARLEAEGMDHDLKMVTSL